MGLPARRLPERPAGVVAQHVAALAQWGEVHVAAVEHRPVVAGAGHAAGIAGVPGLVAARLGERRRGVVADHQPAAAAAVVPRDVVDVAAVEGAALGGARHPEIEGRPRRRIAEVAVAGIVAQHDAVELPGAVVARRVVDVAAGAGDPVVPGRVEPRGPAGVVRRPASRVVEAAVGVVAQRRSVAPRGVALRREVDVAAVAHRPEETPRLQAVGGAGVVGGEALESGRQRPLRGDHLHLFGTGLPGVDPGFDGQGAAAAVSVARFVRRLRRFF